MGGWVGSWVGELVDGWVGGGMDRKIDSCIYIYISTHLFVSFFM